MTIDHLLLKLGFKKKKKKKRSQMINLGFRSDNPGKNGCYTLSDLGEKENPFPWRSVDLSHVVRSHARCPTLTWWWLGRIMVKARTPLISIIKQCHAHFLLQHGDCIRCTKYFSPMIVASGCTWIWFAESTPALVGFLRAIRFPPSPKNQNPSISVDRTSEYTHSL